MAHGAHPFDCRMRTGFAVRSARESEKTAHVGHAGRGIEPMRDGPVVAALEGRGICLTSLRLDERGVQQCRADVAPARGLGDDQVRNPGLWPEREEGLTELEADESDWAPIQQREHRPGV